MKRRGWSLAGLAARLLVAACAGGEAAEEGWRDCLDGTPVEVTAGSEERSTVTLAEIRGEAFDLEAEVRWSRPPRQRGGGFELALGPHGVGSDGYRFVVSRGPWRTVECRGPRLHPDDWQRLSVAVRRTVLEYRLDGELIARCPVQARDVAAARLVARGATVAVRTCRLRAAVGDGVAGGGAQFVYPAERFETSGYPLRDEAAEGARAVAASGRGRGRWLVRGQDGSLPAEGRYAAAFRLRGLSGAGAVWVEVARSGGTTAASAALRLEELPRERFGRVTLAFAAEAEQPYEYRVAAEGGRLAIDDVVVAPARGAARRGEPAGMRRRPRQALPLGEAWKATERQDGPALRVERLRRRLAEGGWYEFTLVWRQAEAARLDGVAADLWVVCRDRWGRVRNLDYGAAYDGVPRGRHTTTAWLSPKGVERYGWPVGFFARLYWRGRPVAKGWRKWGIPVENKWILPAQVVGELRDAPTE